ncbi:MAG TPA: FAD-dependent oxidoreductase, partial [Pseudonocardia sp.]|nr:FAD-dependent oxidoreductase [Pseudonocardia sp.]
MTTTQIAPFDELSAALRGEVIMPADPRYDEVRAVYNGMIDKRPAAIARCRDVADVLACVRFGREYDVTLAVRSGGHSASGLGVWNDALVVDLSLMRSTTVDPEHRTVRVDPGATLGDLDH